MRAVNNKVLVKVDMAQKNAMRIGDTIVKTALTFEKNYRERSPVVGQIMETNRFIREGDIAIFHHNHFYDPSPYYLQDDLYSVPLNKTIFGTLNNYGEMIPVFGNLICKRIPIPSILPLPPDQQKFYINRYEILNPGWTTYKEGAIIFTRPNSGYEIVYNWNQQEKRVIRVDSDMVCGFLKK